MTGMLPDGFNRVGEAMRCVAQRAKQNAAWCLVEGDKQDARDWSDLAWRLESHLMLRGYFDYLHTKPLSRFVSIHSRWIDLQSRIWPNGSTSNISREIECRIRHGHPPVEESYFLYYRGEYPYFAALMDIDVLITRQHIRNIHIDK